MMMMTQSKEQERIPSRKRKRSLPTTTNTIATGGALLSLLARIEAAAGLHNHKDLITAFGWIHGQHRYASSSSPSYDMRRRKSCEVTILHAKGRAKQQGGLGGLPKLRIFPWDKDPDEIEDQTPPSPPSSFSQAPPSPPPPEPIEPPSPPPPPAQMTSPSWFSLPSFPFPPGKPKSSEEAERSWFSLPSFPSPFGSGSGESERSERPWFSLPSFPFGSEEKEAERPWFSLPSFPLPFGFGEEEPIEPVKKKRGRPRKDQSEGEKVKETGEKNFLSWAAASFADFNREWKDQNLLAKRIKKLEKEVARDYRRGDRARAAQYRYDVLKTLEEVQQDLVEVKTPSNRLDIKDAKILTKNQDFFDAEGRVVKPEDMDNLLQKEQSLLAAIMKDEQQWARLASASVGAVIGLIADPSHDFFSVLALSALMTFLTTQSGFIGDVARATGYAVVSLSKLIFGFEKRFELLRKVMDFLYDVIEASVPFRLPWREASTWRNAYRGEGFLHPDVRPAPGLRDAQYVEYLREVKRWVDAEEQAVLLALKKKEDDRIQEVIDRQAQMEQIQKVLADLWGFSTTAAAEAAARMMGTKPKSDLEEATALAGYADLEAFDKGKLSRKKQQQGEGEEVGENEELFYKRGGGGKGVDVRKGGGGGGIGEDVRIGMGGGVSAGPMDGPGA